MTDPGRQLPVGACGDAAPTGDLTRRDHETWRDEIVQWARKHSAVKMSLEVLLAALDGGDEWEIDTARRLAVRTLNDQETSR